MKHRSSYKSALLDRHEPDGAIVFRAVGRGARAATIGGILSGFTGSRMGLDGQGLTAITRVGTLTL
jgi:hypothetical protein